MKCFDSKLKIKPQNISFIMDMISKFYCNVSSKYRLRIFTLNCWGVNLPPLDSSEHRLERMKAIANHIVQNEYDLVFLQVSIFEFFVWHFRIQSNAFMENELINI